MKLNRSRLTLALLALSLAAGCSFGQAGPPTAPAPADTAVPAPARTAVPTQAPTSPPAPTAAPSPTPVPLAISAENAASLRALRTFSGHGEDVLSVDLSPDGRWLATGSADDNVRLWDVASGSSRAVLSGHLDDVRQVAFSPLGDQLASVSEDGTLRLWSVPDGALLVEMSSLLERIFVVRYSPDGSLVALAGNRCFLELRETRHGILRRTLNQPGCVDRDGWATSWGLTFVGGPSLLAMGVGRPCCGGSVYLWDLTDVNDPIWLPHSGAQINALAASPDGSMLAVAANVAAVRLWDVAGREVVHTLAGHLYSATDARFSPDGSLLASGSRDQTVRLWSTADGSALATLAGHSGPVTSVAFSGDGSLVASGSEDDTAILWGLGD
jgi:WD40 repeat protein